MKYSRSLVTALCLIPMLGITSPQAQAEALNFWQYSDKFILYNMRSMHGKIAKACLQSWGKEHPFKNKGRLQFRVIENSVKLMGIGDNMKDDTQTSYPQMILFTPTVNMMGKVIYDLTNPNGWYCLKGQIDNIGAAEINLACQARLTSTEGKVDLPPSDAGSKTVFGKTVVNRRCGSEG